MDVLDLPGATAVRDRWVEDGKVLATAGSAAGIDGGLRHAARLVGEDLARIMQLGIQYEPEPPFGPIDWDPAAVDALRPIWRPPLDDLIATHPHLDRNSWSNA